MLFHPVSEDGIILDCAIMDVSGGNVLIDRNGNWQQYVPATMPVNGEVLGVINDRPTGHIGALVRYTTNGVYVLVRGNQVWALDQARVETALRSVTGR